jgi:hypothetical protein
VVFERVVQVPPPSVEDSHVRIAPVSPLNVIVPLVDPEHPEAKEGERVPLK